MFSKIANHRFNISTTIARYGNFSKEILFVYVYGDYPYEYWVIHFQKVS